MRWGQIETPYPAPRDFAFDGTDHLSHREQVIHRFRLPQTAGTDPPPE